MWPDALNGALPELQQAYVALVQAAAARGISVALNPYGGVRTQADTTQILQYRQQDYNAALRSGAIAADTTLQQFRPIAPWGKSFHDYGAAFDIRAGYGDAAPVWPNTDANALAVLGALAPSLGLRWGGHFTSADPAHFELAISLTDAATRWGNLQASGGTSDALTPTQQMEIVASDTANDPMFWALVAAVTYTGYVLWRAWRPAHRRASHALA